MASYLRYLSQIGEFDNAGLLGQIGQAVPWRAAGLPRPGQGSGDPPTPPAAADLARGLKCLGRGRSGAALQRDQIQVAGQRVPEIGPLLGRVYPHHQVGGEEKSDPEPHRQNGRYQQRRVQARQRRQDLKSRDDAETSQAVTDLAGQPLFPILAERGQICLGHRQPGQRTDPAADRPDRQRIGLPGGDAVDSGQRGIKTRPGRHELTDRHEDAQPDAAASEDHEEVHQLPPVSEAPAETGHGSGSSCLSRDSARNRPGTGIWPSLCSQNRPAAYRQAPSARTISPTKVPYGAEYDRLKIANKVKPMTKPIIQRRVVRCSARLASISRRAATSLESNSASALSTPCTPPPRCPVAISSAATIRSAAGSSISSANASSASWVSRRADSRLASAETWGATAAGAVLALTSSASSRPRLVLSMSASRRIHCSRPSSVAVRCRAVLVDISLGTKAAPSPAAIAATGHRVMASMASPTTTASAIFLPF